MIIFMVDTLTGQLARFCLDISKSSGNQIKLPSYLFFRFKVGFSVATTGSYHSFSSFAICGHSNGQPSLFTTYHMWTVGRCNHSPHITCGPWAVIMIHALLFLATSPEHSTWKWWCTRKVAYLTRKVLR